MTKTVHETLINFELFSVEIPRPKCTGLEFVPTRGRQGFYKSIRNEGHKYGVQIKPMGPRRPTIPDFWNMTSAKPVIETMSATKLEKNNITGSTFTTSVDTNGNEILPPPKFTSHLGHNYAAIPEEPEMPEPDYDEPTPKSTIPPPPPLPAFLLKHTIRL